MNPWESFITTVATASSAVIAAIAKAEKADLTPSISSLLRLFKRDDISSNARFPPSKASSVIFPISWDHALSKLDIASVAKPCALKSFSLSVTSATTLSLSLSASLVNPKEERKRPRSELASTVPVASPSTPANNELNSIPAAPEAIESDRVSSTISDTDAPALRIETNIALYILVV